jgi:hypothetical protein
MAGTDGPSGRVSSWQTQSRSKARRLSGSYGGKPRFAFGPTIIKSGRLAHGPCGDEGGSGAAGRGEYRDRSRRERM